MDERNKLNFLYSYDENWIGGTYYIVNIIKVLNFLDDIEKPEIIVYHKFHENLKPLYDINYPYIKYQGYKIKINIFGRIINKVSNVLFNRVIIKPEISKSKINNFYPMQTFLSTSNIKNFYYWIPDFQEKYLPEFFTKQELLDRKTHQEYLVKNKYPIIFSSNNALEDFNRFYPNNTNVKKTLKFVSVVNVDYSKIDIEKLKEKFKINKEYFISPNQFWRHKNHIVIVEAVKKLKDKGHDILVVFTGKEFDYRSPDYVMNLKEKILDLGLRENFLFLGFIDRLEQLQLMKNSIAIIQPSLFEGWSTVVEDTKALNHKIILSDLPLHREQINNHCLFFDPKAPDDLADKILDVKSIDTTIDFHNNQEIKNLARRIINIFN